MRYRNTVTGAVIDVKSKITGGNWQAETSAVSSVKETPAPTKRKVNKKKDDE